MHAWKCVHHFPQPEEHHYNNKEPTLFYEAEIDVSSGALKRSTLRWRMALSDEFTSDCVLSLSAERMPQMATEGVRGPRVVGESVA